MFTMHELHVMSCHAGPTQRWRVHTHRSRGFLCARGKGKDKLDEPECKGRVR